MANINFGFLQRRSICTVCADDATVRAHILPRALFHDGKTQGRMIILGGREEGYRVTQSGKWDGRILCEHHERSLAAADKYGIEFCRAWRRLRKSGADEAMVSNPTPHLLVDFALASAWRMAAAVSRGEPFRALGRHADLIEGRLFGPGKGCNPPVTVESFEIDDGKGAPLVIGVLPARYRADGSSWHFIVSGLRFEVHFGDEAPAGGTVNDAPELMLRFDALHTIDEVPGLRDSLTRMSMPKRRSPSS